MVCQVVVCGFVMLLFCGKLGMPGQVCYVVLRIAESRSCSE